MLLRDVWCSNRYFQNDAYASFVYLCRRRAASVGQEASHARPASPDGGGVRRTCGARLVGRLDGRYLAAAFRRCCTSNDGCTWALDSPALGIRDAAPCDVEQTKPRATRVPVAADCCRAIARLLQREGRNPEDVLPHPLPLQDSFRSRLSARLR